MTDHKLNLVVVAHPDDEILGFGASGAKFVARGERVQPIILCGDVDVRTQRPTNDELSHDIAAANAVVGFSEPVLSDFPNIRLNSIDHLVLVQFIEKQIAEFRPSRVFTHHPADLNDDHNQIARACLAAARLFQRRDDLSPPLSIHFMEIPSSTDWSFPGVRAAFEPNEFVEVNEFIDKKIEALNCYRRVMRPFPHPRSPEIIRGLAALRGGQCGLGYAEAFQTVFSTALN